MKFAPHCYFLIKKKSTLVFEQPSPSSYSKQHVQYSVVDIAAVALWVELPERGPEQALLHGRRLGLLAHRRFRFFLSFAWTTNCRSPAPSANFLFRIQVTLPNNRRRDKTSQEFGNSLMAFLRKRAESVAMEYSLFRSSLRKFNPESDSSNVNN